MLFSPALISDSRQQRWKFLGFHISKHFRLLELSSIQPRSFSLPFWAPGGAGLAPRKAEYSQLVGRGRARWVEAQGPRGARGAGCSEPHVYSDDTVCVQTFLELSPQNGLWGVGAPLHTYSLVAFFFPLLALLHRSLPGARDSPDWQGRAGLGRDLFQRGHVEGSH